LDFPLGETPFPPPSISPLLEAAAGGLGVAAGGLCAAASAGRGEAGLAAPPLLLLVSLS